MKFDLIAFVLSFYVETPVAAGILTGAVLFGAPLYIIGWFHGGESNMRKVGGWMRPKIAANDEMPGLPPARERRLNTVVHREWMS